MDIETPINPPGEADHAPVEEPAMQDAVPYDRAVAPRRLLWIDLLVCSILASIAAFGFYRHASGDLFSDEADYALASTSGFEANRWDRSNDPRQPDRLIAARHYHAPLTADLIEFAHRFGAADHTIRMPFIVSGGLLVAAVYLCGLSLFDRRREIAVGCAALVAITPAIVRMASHALPWAPIILEFLLLLWCLAEFTRSRNWGWITGALTALGALFVTSEMFFIAVPAVIVAAPLILLTDLQTAKGRKSIMLGLGVGAALFLVTVLFIWPSGLHGESVNMLRHYIQMRNSESFPVNVGSQVFPVAPKWAYLYWYWNDYKPFFACYAVGVPVLMGLAASRKLHMSLAPLASLTALLLITSHRAHIIGPEYLAPCLPFLTLLGGYAVAAAGLIWRPLALLALIVLAVPVLRWTPHKPLPGMDARAQISRWPAAARYLGSRWRAGDKIIVGSQPVSVARWYLVYHGRVPSHDSQFQVLPIHEPKHDFLERLRHRFYRYVAVSNMFEDGVDLDPRTRLILQGYLVLWQSEENGSGPARLTIYAPPPKPPDRPLQLAPIVNTP